MRIVVWTPARRPAWCDPLAKALAPGSELAVLHAEPPERPLDTLDLYHVAAAPEHGFVYRALIARPGIVLLAEWQLHALVHAETAGRGDPRGYLREARHSHGDTGEFVARQVLAGIGGALPGLLATNQRVLDASLAVVAATQAIRERTAALVTDRPVVFLRLAEASDAAPVAKALAALIAETAPLAGERRAHAAARLAAAGPRARAVNELRWAGRELGLAEPPRDAVALAAGLFGEAR